MTDRDARVTELEIALAHQERLGEELSDVVRTQADRLARARAADRGAHRAGGGAGSRRHLPSRQADARPPHW